jgi:hypothetical protein
MLVNGTQVQPGVAHEVTLGGNDKAIRVHVESADGNRSAEYVVTVER